MMTSSAMAAGVVTEGDHKSTAETHRPKCVGDALPVDFSVKIYDIKLNVASTDSRAYVDYKTETIWKRCADNGALRQSTRAYAVFGAKYCELSGWYGTQVNGVHKNAFDCVKYIGLPPDDYKGGSALACEKPPSLYGTTNADCLTKPYGEAIAKEDNQPSTISSPTISDFKGEVDSDGDGFYVPNWQNAKKNSGSKTFSLGTMCQYFKYGNGFDKTTNDKTSWRRCASATITVKWKVPTPPPVTGNFNPAVRVNPEIVEPYDEEYEEDAMVSGGNIPYRAVLGPKNTVQFQLARLIYPPNSPMFSQTSSSDDPDCAFYGTPACEPTFRTGNVPESGLPWSEPDGPLYIKETFPDNLPPGSRVCYTMAVEQPPSVEVHTYTLWQHNGQYDEDGFAIYEEYTYSHYFYSDVGDPSHNGQPATNPVPRPWKYDTKCVMVGKRPKVQILGSDLRVRGETRTKVTSHTTGGNRLYFGSWVEYAALTRDTDSAPASGAGYRNGTTSPETARSEWSKLTFANTPEYGGFSSLPSAPAIADYYKQQTDGKGALPSGSQVTGGTYRNNAASTEISESTGLTGTTILYSEGTVTIKGNIAYSGNSFTSLDEIPQVIIVAENIKIEKDVERIDAWLIAYGENGDASKGNIDTCSNGPVPGPLPVTRTSDTCNKPLEVNGPVVANGLYLNRTGPSNGGPSDAAEKFRLRPDAYIWAQARQRSTGAARTVDIVELPPRF